MPMLSSLSSKALNNANKKPCSLPQSTIFWARAVHFCSRRSWSSWKSVISSLSFRGLILAVLSTQVTEPVKGRDSSPCPSAYVWVHQTIKSSKWTVLCFCSNPEYLCFSCPSIRLFVFKVHSNMRMVIHKALREEILDQTFIGLASVQWIQLHLLEDLKEKVKYFI